MTNFADSDASTAQQEIQAHLDEMLLAANAGDTDRFMVAFVQSPDLVFTIQDLTLVGWEALREQQLQWWDYGNSKGEYTQRTAPIIKHLAQNCAVTVQALAASSPLPDGTRRSRHLSFTAIWKKLPETGGSKWLTSHSRHERDG